MISIILILSVCVSSLFSEQTLRIAAGPRGAYDGRLEVLHSGIWKNICDDSFNIQAARVACRQLEFYNPNNIDNIDFYTSKNNTWFRNGGDYWLDDVQCKGTEARIEDCVHAVWGSENCNDQEVVGVKCDIDGLLTRLDNESFIEVHHNGEWHGICPTDYSEQMGMVVCQYLGFNRSHVFAKELSANVSDDTTVLPFILDCIGNETNLGDCLKNNENKTCPVKERSRLACLNGTVEETISLSCSGNSFGITVDLDRLRILFPDLINNDILLGGTCTGRLDGNKLVFDQNFDLCSTRSKEVDDQTLMFTNNLVYLHVNPDGIIRHFLWAVDLQCLVSRNESTEISYIPVESNHVHHLGNSSHLQVNINLFSDALFHHPLQDVATEAVVGSEIFVQVQSPNIVGLRMIVENCYAKPDHDANKQRSFSLIENGCEVDTETHITRYADTETRFFFTAFAFPTGDQIVAVHCDVRYCSTAPSSSRSTCRHGCHSGPGIIGR
ncbi:hypothetical protein SNE40_023156 [Patella caerulea]|uniref:Uncharacterized protein n=1 Tax=Patella caerulea TaxID=87958 RepID=A0AAN8FXW4_PATCE